MKKLLLALSIVLVGVSAQADHRDRDHDRRRPPYPDHNIQVQDIYCESRDYRYNECYTNLRFARIRGVTQISRSPCIEGSTFGFNYGRVWVTNGCRGYFRLIGR